MPGSGIPSAASDSARNCAEIMPAARPATSNIAKYQGQVERTREVGVGIGSNLQPIARDSEPVCHLLRQSGILFMRISAHGRDLPASIAQWIRATGFYPVGRGFESCWGHFLGDFGGETETAALRPQTSHLRFWASHSHNRAIYSRIQVSPPQDLAPPSQTVVEKHKACSPLFNRPLAGHTPR